MALSDTQIRQLKAKLNPTHIRTRSSNSANLSYIEGWHAIAEANRILGTTPGTAELSIPLAFGQQ